MKNAKKEFLSRRFWEAMVYVGVIITITFIILELIGFFKEEGVVGAFLGILITIFASLKTTMRILENIDVKTTLLCQENVKTREEIIKALNSDGEKTRKHLGSKMDQFGSKIDQLGSKMDGIMNVLMEIRDRMEKK